MFKIGHRPCRTALKGWVIFLCLLLTGCAYEVLHYSDNPRKTFASNNATLTSIPASGVHTVERGETLFAIAFRYGLDYRELAKFNRINPPYIIYPNQKIRLDVSAGPSNVAAGSNATQTRSTESKNVVTKANETVSQPNAVAKESAVVIPSSSPAIVNTPASNSAQRAVVPIATNDAPVGAWGWPVDGQVVGRFSNTGVGSKGINIKADEGSLVKAVADGTVVYAGSGLIGYGNLVIVKHNDVYLSAYAYNERILVKEQQTVQLGDSLAVIGGKGNERPLLHFEIRRDGKPVDPMSILPKR